MLGLKVRVGHYRATFRSDLPQPPCWAMVASLAASSAR